MGGELANSVLVLHAEVLRLQGRKLNLNDLVTRFFGEFSVLPFMSHFSIPMVLPFAAIPTRVAVVEAIGQL